MQPSKPKPVATNDVAMNKEDNTFWAAFKTEAAKKAAHGLYTVLTLALVLLIARLFGIDIAEMMRSWP